MALFFHTAYQERLIETLGKATLSNEHSRWQRVKFLGTEMQDILNGIDIRIAFKMGYVHNFYREPAFRAIEVQYKIKRPEILTLIFLGFQDGVTAAEICEFSGHLKTNIIRAVHDLNDKGLLRREADVNDKRRQLLHLLPKGKEMVAAFMPSLIQREQWMLEPLSPREREQFERLLDKLAAHVPEWPKIQSGKRPSTSG